MDSNIKSGSDDKELVELLEVRRQLDELNAKFARLCDRISTRISSAQLSAALDLVSCIPAPKNTAGDTRRPGGAAANLPPPVRVPVVTQVRPVAQEVAPATPVGVPRVEELPMVQVPSVIPIRPAAQTPAPVDVPSVVPVAPPQTGQKTMRDALAEILAEAQKPLSFEKIYEKLEVDGFPLPAERPKLVVRQVLFNKALFTVTNTGAFVLTKP